MASYTHEYSDFPNSLEIQKGKSLMALYRCSSGGSSSSNSLTFAGTVTMSSKLNLSNGNSNDTLSCSTNILQVSLGSNYTTLTKNTLSGCTATLSGGTLTIKANKSEQKYYSPTSQTTYTHSVTIKYNVTVS